MAARRGAALHRRLAAVDRKTVRRYVEAATAAGLDRHTGEEALGDEPAGPVAVRTSSSVPSTSALAGVEGRPGPQFGHGSPRPPRRRRRLPVLESLLPLIEGLGVSTRDEIGIDTYVHRLGTEAVAHHAVGSAAPVVGAWSTVLAG